MSVTVYIAYVANNAYVGSNEEGVASIDVDNGHEISLREESRVVFIHDHIGNIVGAFSLDNILGVAKTA